MEITDLIKKLEVEFDEVPEGSLNPETSFRDIDNWGSMHALIIIALADTEYDVVISGADLKKLIKIQDLFDLIKERVG